MAKTPLQRAGDAVADQRRRREEALRAIADGLGRMADAYRGASLALAELDAVTVRVERERKR